MKIIYIDPFVIPEMMGGSQKSLLDIMVEMKRRGHESILATPGNGLLALEAKKRGILTVCFFLPPLVDTRAKVFNWSVFNIFAAIYDFFAFVITSLSLLKVVIKNKPAIVHSNQMTISIAAGIAAKLANIPCLWHIRENPSPRVPKFILKTFGFFAKLLSNKVVVNSNYTANLFRNTQMFRKIVVIPIGIQFSEYPDTKKPLQEKNKLEQQLKTISIIGRVIPMKGHDTLITASSYLNQNNHDFKLLIQGHFDQHDPYYLSLISAINKLNLGGKIHFLGFNKNINSTLFASDIIVSCSREPETFGRTLIEAMAAGKPIIATDLGAHLEIIENNINGFLVEPDNPEQLAEKLEIILNNSETAKELGNNGNRIYRSKFTLKKYCSRLEDIYFELENSTV